MIQRKRKQTNWICFEHEIILLCVAGITTKVYRIKMASRIELNSEHRQNCITSHGMKKKANDKKEK